MTNELDLTESSEHGKLCGVIGHSAYQPIDSCLPHRVEKAVETREPHMSREPGFIDNQV